jgi:hypothetical protein
MSRLSDGQPEKSQPAPAPAGTLRLGRLAGFDILVHWSWLLIFALLTWSLASGYLPEIYPNWTRGEYWLTGVVTSLLFFASVLGHELSHSIIARRRGLPVENITLFVFGGVSALGGEPRNARDEFWIAIVGPLTSFAAAAVFGVIWALTPGTTLPQLHALAGYLAYINVIVGDQGQHAGGDAHRLNRRPGDRRPAHRAGHPDHIHRWAARRFLAHPDRLVPLERR